MKCTGWNESREAENEQRERRTRGGGKRDRETER